MVAALVLATRPRLRTSTPTLSVLGELNRISGELGSNIADLHIGGAITGALDNALPEAERAAATRPDDSTIAPLVAARARGLSQDDVVVEEEVVLTTTRRKSDSADAALSLIASDAVFAEFTVPSFDSAQFASAGIAADQGAAARGGGGARGRRRRGWRAAQVARTLDHELHGLGPAFDHLVRCKCRRLAPVVRLSLIHI